jgi:hypothetical protein
MAAAALFATALLTPLAAHAGFTVKIFAEPNDTGADVTFGALLDEFDSDHISFFSGAETSDVDGWPVATQMFGAEITGFLHVASPGEFPLSLGSDDGAYLFVNDQLVIARPGDRSYAKTTVAVTLPEGYSTFRIAYYNGPCCGTGLTFEADGLVTITPVPEPSTYALMAGGFALVGAGARLRRKPA